MMRLAVFFVLIGFLNPLLAPFVYAWETEGSGEVNVLYHYDRDKAVEYAKDWWNKRNPDCANFENDCANFVSQALYAGGWPMNQNWYCHPKPWWERVIFFFWSLYNDLYFREEVSQSSYNQQWKWSHSWSVVKDLETFILDSERGKLLNEKDEKGQPKPLTPDFLKSLVIEDHLQIGDIIIINYKEEWISGYHAMIVTNVDKEKGDIGVTYHSKDRDNISLLDLMKKDYPNSHFFAYHLKNYFDR